MPIETTGIDGPTPAPATDVAGASDNLSTSAGDSPGSIADSSRNSLLQLAAAAAAKAGESVAEIVVVMGVEEHRRDRLDRKAALLGDDPHRFDGRPAPGVVRQRRAVHR